MAYDHRLADRVRNIIALDFHVEERKMFGGLAFLCARHLFVGILGDRLMVRTGNDRYTDAIRRKNVRPMDFTGRVMRGYVYVDPPGIRTAAQLRFWVEWGKSAISREDGPPPVRSDSPRDHERRR